MRRPRVAAELPSADRSAVIAPRFTQDRAVGLWNRFPSTTGLVDTGPVLSGGGAMRICDLITVHDAARSVDLATVSLLAEAVGREGADLTLGTASQLRELLAEFVTAESQPVDLLRVILGLMASDGERGGAFLVRGPGGSGKSHLLAVISLLLQHPVAWSVFLETHPSYADLHGRLSGRRHLVVPIPLPEHRGHDEHLEDVVFDRTERVLRGAPYQLAVPLSERSHALDLIDRHIVPRYAKELTAYARKHAAGYESWESLREHAPEQAVQVARQFAHQIGYPLDFRQSRVERLSRLLEIVREQRLSGIVWLLDDLHEFLGGEGPKAVHSDCSFLDFVGQRCKIAPLFVVATGEEGLEQLTTIEPYMLNAIRSSFRTDLNLSLEHMRAVARRRVIGRAEPGRYGPAMEQVRAAYQAAFGTVSFSEPELAEAYPLHPTALRCLETIAARFFGAADTLIAFMQDLMTQSTSVGTLQRDYRQLIGTEDVFDYLRPRIASHPEVSAYIRDALDFYVKNASELFPEAPDLCVQLMRSLIVLRLANVAASPALLAETLGLTPEGKPVATQEQVERALEAMRLAGSYVDVRRGLADSPPVYVVDVRTSISEALRRRVMAAKAAFGPDDRRLWQHVISACDETAFPLAQLVESRTLEVEWQNTFRCICAHLADLTELPPAAVSDYVADLGDPATVEDAHLFVGSLASPAAQAQGWRRVCEATPASRWSAALLAWLPRELTPHEMDALREFAAVSALLEDEAALSADSTVGDRLAEMRAPLLVQVRRIVRAAYYEGEVRSPFEQVVTSAELAALNGNWSGTMQAITARAFERVFPEFPAVAPRRALVSREQIDTLIDQVIRPGSVLASPEDPLRDLIECFLVPMGLAQIRDDECIVDVSRSKVAAEVMAAVRRRDQAHQHEMGRPLDCSDLAQQLVKSPLGLPPEMFELAVAALIRTGHLAAMRDRTQMLRLEDVATPLSGSVHFVARPPVLSPGEWQLLARVGRAVLDLTITTPDPATQVRVWERLVAARGEYLDRADALRRRLEQHLADLEQRPGQWSETFRDLEALERIFQCVRPELHPVLGLQEFLRDTEDFLGDAQGPPRLAGLLRRLETLSAYLGDTADEVLAVRRYLLSPDLNLQPRSDLDQRRQAVLELIAGGEDLLDQEVALRRQVQIFHAAYHRRYVAWHGRVYRSPVFDQYRAVHQSPEMRALAQLGKVRVEVPVTAEDVAAHVDAQVARRCARPDLSEALQTSPVCPSCRLRLDEEPQLIPVEDLLEEARQAIRGYLQALLGAGIRQRLRDYAAGMTRRSDLATRLEAIAELDEHASPRVVLTLFTEDVITHLNRMLAGKRVVPRDFRELRDALEGRTLSKEEAQRLFQEWLNGSNDAPDDNGLLEISS